MPSRSAGPTEVPPSAPPRGAPIARRQPPVRPAHDEPACRPLSALAYAARCHAGQVRESDGAPIIEHLSEVARLLRDAGCADVVIAAGLLHRVVQDTEVSAAALTERFGATVAGLVAATTIDCVGSYPQRRHALREQIRNADPAAAMLFAANEIAEVRALADQVRRERARTAVARSAGRAPSPLERYQQMRMQEYHASLSMLQAVAPRHRLVRQLAIDLERCPISVRRARPRALKPSPAP
jgi:(p)ppGpp synthase/HD superfamily hydrolase